MREASVKKKQENKSDIAEYEQAPGAKPRAKFPLLALAIQKQKKKTLST